MKKVLYNAKIYVEKNKFVEAVLIEKNKIKQIGSNEEILKNKNVDESINCLGNTIIPGFNDSHLHMFYLGQKLYQVKISDCKTIDEIVKRCKVYLNKYPDKVKSGIHAQGWNQDLFVDQKRMPTRFDLDKISKEIPIVLERSCGHIVSTNSKVIEMLNLNKGSAQYQGGEFELDEEGYPNGIFKEKACDYARSTIPKITLEQRRESFINLSKYLASYGITSVQSNDIGAVVENDKKYFDLLNDIYDKNEGTIRYRHQLCFSTPDEFENYIKFGEYTKKSEGKYKEDSMVTLGPVKLFKDGSLGSRTALMKRPYLDEPENIGVESISDEDTKRYCEIAKKHNIQVITHVIGDLAIDKVLSIYEKNLENGQNKNRNVLLHCQITDELLIEKIAKLGILVNYQPIFLNYDMHILEKRCGKKLSSTSYAFSTLQKLGGKISYSTDSPIEEFNPFFNIYSAVTRKDLSGYPEEGFYPKECVDVYTAIDAYTEGSAYMEFMEGKKGRIKEGQLADIIVLDKDIFTCNDMEIKDILPILTMVDGNIVYRKEI